MTGQQRVHKAKELLHHSILEEREGNGGNGRGEIVSQTMQKMAEATRGEGDGIACHGLEVVEGWGGGKEGALRQAVRTVTLNLLHIHFTATNFFSYSVK